jgi:hypothetical protein
MSLVHRAIEHRGETVVDSSLSSYAARGEGYVYFVVDATDSPQETLIRTDQVAVDLYWRAPNEVRQRIVGLRDQRELPITRLNYYIDRFTIVQDDYGQSIVIADGDNVRNVPHPVGEGATDIYDYRLVDSLTLRLPDTGTQLRILEVQVRPKQPEEPGVIGSVFLEEKEGAVARMDFTFTPSSYIDPRLDYINVSLENGLWLGSHWLPREQRLEIRREVPELQLPFGTVIRTRMRIGDYRFNEPVPASLFLSRTGITLAPESERRNFPFDRPIDAEWRAEGFSAPLPMEEIRRRAEEIAVATLRRRAASGLPSTRLAAGPISEVVRYNRAEGLVFSQGVASQRGGMAIRAQGGWAFGERHPVARINLRDLNEFGLRGSLYLKQSLEIGGTRAASGLANTLATLFAGRDWSDPFYTSGGSIESGKRLSGRWSLRASGRAEYQESARNTADFSFFESSDSFRPVRAIDEGTHFSVTAAVRRELSPAGGGWAELRTTAGTLAGADSSFSFGRAELTGGFTRAWSARHARLDITGVIGTILGSPPRQELTLLGGRGTLPGYGFHTSGGTEYANLELRAGADIVRPWLRGHLYAGAGGSRLSNAGKAAAELLDVTATKGILPSVGAGVGLFYDLLHIDFARGLRDGGRTELIIEFPATFWDFL